MTVRVVTDSASDLPPDLARELDIIVVPGDRALWHGGLQRRRRAAD